MPSLLNIAALTSSTEVLGPGRRFALWVQGCPFRCKGCIAPQWIPFTKANILDTEHLARQVILQEGLDGISISGGEPMVQAGELADFLASVRAERPALTVIVFSGFRIEQLHWPAAQRLLAATDLLIDGLYMQQRNDGQGLRGSSNQRFHFLTERLLSFRDSITDARQGLEYQIQPDGVLQVGIPPRDFQWPSTFPTSSIQHKNNPTNER